MKRKIKTQKDWVKSRLELKGTISRNEALRNYVSRLGAIIATLKKEGYAFDGKYVKIDTPFGWKGTDYIYTQIKKGSKDV